jgi:membrane-bound lytic murein transglycosylase D
VKDMSSIRDLKFGLLIISILLVFSSLFGNNNWTYDESLKTDVQFWKDIFTLYSKDQNIIHDAENLDIIYQIVTFDTSISEYFKERHLENKKREIKRFLLEIAKHPEKIEPRNHSERQILEQFKDDKDPGKFRKAANQIRAQQGMRENFEEGLERALNYLPFMKEVFRESGLPEELAYLPHIESSFNPLARSRAGAAGMWQFMRSTGRLYMKVNRIIDQRYDPIVSTKAAARLLRYNYQKTGDWGLAVTAYNFGLAGIKKAIKRYGSDYIKVRESFNHRKFKFASRNFYPEFLAVIEIMREFKKYFPDIKPASVSSSMHYQLRAAVKLPRLLKQLKIEMSEFRSLNPVYTRRAIKGWVYVPAGYWIYLPIKSDLAKLNEFFRNNRLELAESGGISKKKYPAKKVTRPSKESELADEIKTNNQQSNGSLVLRKPGVTSDISAWIHSPQTWGREVLASHNQSTVSIEKIKTELNQKIMVKENYIVVFANETLGHFADWLNISLRKLQNINDLGRRRTIYQGQRLKVSFTNVSIKEFQEKRINYHLQLIMSFLDKKELVNLVDYEINSGESVWELARYRHKIPVEIIQYFNIHSDINNLYPGDILRIPIFRNINTLEETL